MVFGIGTRLEILFLPKVYYSMCISVDKVIFMATWNEIQKLKNVDVWFIMNDEELFKIE